MRVKVLGLIIWLCTTFVSAQPEEAVEILFDDDIVATYIDRPGDIYVAFEKDGIKKFDIKGNLIAEGDYDHPTIFDPWYGINILMHNKNKNKYTITDRNLGNQKEFTIDSVFAIEPLLICFSGEKNIWLLDKADMSLKRINTIEGNVESESIIPQAVVNGRDFIFMREYQNFLFLQDHKGTISVFNQLGLHIRDINTTGLETFNFLGEELYYCLKGQLMFFDLFDGKMRSKSIQKNASNVLLTGSRTILVFQRKILIVPNNY